MKLESSSITTHLILVRFKSCIRQTRLHKLTRHHHHDLCEDHPPLSYSCIETHIRQPLRVALFPDWHHCRFVLLARYITQILRRSQRLQMTPGNTKYFRSRLAQAPVNKSEDDSMVTSAQVDPARSEVSAQQRACS